MKFTEEQMVAIKAQHDLSEKMLLEGLCNFIQKLDPYVDWYDGIVIGPLNKKQ